MGILQRASREIYLFFLTADWTDILNRLTDRHGQGGHHNLLAELGRASFYEHKHYLFSFPAIRGITERTIDTTGKTADSVAEEIIKVARI
jgi:hypothetical protein